MQYDPTSGGARRRNTAEMNKRRSFSPQYAPLLEERESVSEEASVRSEEDGDPGNGEEGSTRHHRVEYEERVVILSDHGRGEENGDADSGISLSEDHPGSRHPQAAKQRGQEPLPLLVVQIVIPFFFAGFGMMAAGLLLDTVQVSRAEWSLSLGWR